MCTTLVVHVEGRTCLWAEYFTYILNRTLTLCTKNENKRSEKGILLLAYFLHFFYLCYFCFRFLLLTLFVVSSVSVLFFLCFFYFCSFCPIFYCFFFNYLCFFLFVVFILQIEFSIVVLLHRRTFY